MRKSSFILLSLILFGCFSKRLSSGWDVKKIAKVFEQTETAGTFVCYDSKADFLLMFDESRAHQAFSPASTFKIPHSLIGLQTHAVHDVDEVFFKYDGQTKYDLESWQADGSLRTAIKISQVPAYQELARRIGAENMRKQLDNLDYGNHEIGGTIDNFWLKGPLKITAVQQAYFLAKLADETLPLDKEVQESVKEICELERGSDWILYGKTGWAVQEKDGLGIGWFVGWIERKEGNYSFAVNIDMTNSNDDLPKRIEVTKECLRALKLI